MAAKGTLTKDVQILFHGRRTGASLYTWGGGVLARGETRWIKLEDHWLALIKRGDAEIIQQASPPKPVAQPKHPASG